MKFSVRPFELAHDYTITEGWRRGHGQVALPEHMFMALRGLEPPPGVVVSDEAGTDCAAAWLYRDAAGILCWMAWTVTNPNIPARKAVGALDTAEDYLESIAQEEGFVYMVGMFKQESMVEHFVRRLGFTRCDTGKGHFMTVKGLL